MDCESQKTEFSRDERETRDRARALGLFEGNAEQYKRWVLNFITQAPEDISNIRRLIHAGLREEARMQSLIFKGTATMLGLADMAEFAQALVKALEEDESTVLIIDRLNVAVFNKSNEVG